jgi:hypothetical protein
MIAENHGQPHEINYGSFATYVNGGFLYLLGSDDTGIKIARVKSSVDTIADRTQVRGPLNIPNITHAPPFAVFVLQR